jgi:hypothetical protein
MALRYVALLAALLAGCGSEPRAASGPRLYLAGDGEYWVVDAATERVRHVVSSQLKPGDPPHRILTRGDRVVMGTPFGDSAFFLPSARADRVWVVDLRATDGTVRTVREVTVDGETTVTATRIPSLHWPLGAVRDGLLLDRGNAVDVWDPASRRVVHQLPVTSDELGPATGDTVTACIPPCILLRLIDVRSGGSRGVRAPPHVTMEPWNAAFSPAGDMLAITVYQAVAPATAPRRLALIDVAAARMAIVPGSRVPPGYNEVAWSASGTHVFLTGGRRFERRAIVGYRLGTRQAQTLDVDVGDFYDAAAI